MDEYLISVRIRVATPTRQDAEEIADNIGESLSHYPGTFENLETGFEVEEITTGRIACTQ